MLVYSDTRLLESIPERLIWMNFLDTRLPERGSEVINTDACLQGYSTNGQRYRSGNADAR